jgi:GNAT superfamily N-acetyltransferase
MVAVMLRLTTDISGDTTMPLFCDTALAERIERAEAGLISDSRRAEGFLIPVSGGVANFAATDSPFNKVAGLGFGGVPGDEALEEIEQAFAARHTPVQVELASLADPAIGALLTRRGYELVSFENVLGLVLQGDHEPPADVRLSPDDEFEAWLDVVVDGFAHPDVEGVPTHEEFPREVLAGAMRDFAAAGVRRYVAVRDGVIAGAASFRVAGTIAQLTGAATAPVHRRKGVQTALLRARLALAAAAGAEVAVVTTQPGSKSQENVQRQGFDLLYTRAILVKHAQLCN